MTEIKTDGPGTVKISDDAIATIACAAIMETDGIYGLAGYTAQPGPMNKKQAMRGIAVTVENCAVSVTADISVKHGIKIQDVTREAQQRVKTAVETMTGLAVSEVNINVSAAAKQRNA